METLHGLSIEDVFKLFDNFSSDYYDEVKKFTKDELEEYKVLLQQFKESYENKSTNKGKVLEYLVKFIFEKSKIFKIHTNLHTSTNEIDDIIQLSDLGNMCTSKKLIDIKGEYLIGECKNYSQGIDVTWVGKFCNLVACQGNCRLGILFSYCGFKGVNNWDSSKGLAKKFYYLKENEDEKMFIIDFNLSDFERIVNGETFIDIVNAKISELETDTNISKYLTIHPAQEQA